MYVYQPLPPVLITAAAGILTDRFFAPHTSVWLVLCCTALGLWFVSTNRTQDIPALRIFPLICLYTACFAFFGFRHHDNWYRFAADDIGCYADRLGQPAGLRGTVAEMPRYYPKPPPDPGRIFDISERTAFTLHVRQLRDGTKWIPVSGNCFVMIYTDCRNLRIGDHIEIFGELMQPQKPGNPGDYDYAGYLRSHRILAVLKSPDETALTILYKNYFTAGRWIESLRRIGVKNLEQHLSPQTEAVAEAMIFGVRESVDDEIRQSMIETGTMHLLAISGLHVALIAGIAAFLLRQMRFSRRTISLTMIGFVLFYLMLTDVRTPAIRASALICSCALAGFLNRKTSAQNLLCGSALIVLLIHPPELFQFGAQLSFLAVGSFLWLPRFCSLPLSFTLLFPAQNNPETSADAEQTEPAYSFYRSYAARIFRNIIQLFMISLIIWLIGMPLLLANIHLFTPVALLVNPLLWIPLTMAMFCGFMTAMTGGIPLLGSLFGYAADLSFRLLLGMIAWFQSIGGHYWVPGLPDWWNIGFYSVFAFFTFMPVKRPKRLLTAGLIVWITLGIASGYYREYDRRKDDRLTLSVFSVGHGNCVLILTPESKTIICDAGCLASPRHAADVLSNALWRHGKTRIDAVLISHPDNDHFNGVALLADRFTIGAVFISPYFDSVKKMPEQQAWEHLKTKLASKNVPLKIVSDGDDFSSLGFSSAKIIHPPKDNFADRNNANAASLVLRWEHNGTGVLLTGDLDGSEPSPFLLRKQEQTDIVLMPHHGGKSSQADRLLDWAKPKTLIYSSGKMTYKPEKLEQLRRQGYEVQSTFEEGAIEIRIGSRR